MPTQYFKTVILDLLRQDHTDEEMLMQGLSEAEKATNGTWEHWSAKDYFTHLTFWHQSLFTSLTTILQGKELPKDEEDEDQLNSEAFEKNKLHPWSAVYADLEHIYVKLFALIERLSEEELTDTVRFVAITNGRPLYTAFLGSFYEHDQEHLAQYYVDRNNLERAIQIREKCVSRIIQSDLQDWIKGSFLYNLACFYSSQNLLEQASARLQEALALAPNLAERSKNDPDLAALYN